MISIVMPVFNAEAWLDETLASVKGQTYQNWELIAVDDGSTDQSLKVLNKFAAEFTDRVRIISITNSGPSRARNLGMELAAGVGIALLDADDIWEPEKLEIQVAWLGRHPASIACTCDFGIYDDRRRETLYNVHFDWSQKTVNQWALLEGFGPGLCSSLLIRSAALREVGGFNESISNAEDTEFALRILKVGPIGSPAGVLMQYRKSDNQNHANLDTISKGIESLMQLHPFVDSESLRQRVRSNARTLIAVKSALRGDFPAFAANLVVAFRTSGASPFRLIFLTTLRKLFRA